MPAVGILARELSKRFDPGGPPAVDALSFEVAAGEVYGLIGPNGAGKTTTLRMLAGLMQPTGGEARIHGHRVATEGERARAALGFLTGSTGLYARLTVRELLHYFGALYGLERPAIARRVDELAGLLQFAPLLDRRCAGLSTGERQRVSLARAVLHDPEVLILDEPTAGLDVVASRFVADFVREARARGRAILFSTHYMTEAELLCDRIGLLHAGRLIWEGAPAALKAELEASSLEDAFLRLLERTRAAESPP
jgi:ABC-type Na+ transport system ATPase subunit NatA